MSPLSRLARLLNTSERQAWDFSLGVRALFKNTPPDVPAIVKCIEQNHPVPCTPNSVAEILKGSSDSPQAPSPIAKNPNSLSPSYSRIR